MSSPTTRPVLPPEPVLSSAQDSLLRRFRQWLRSNLRDKPHDNSLREALEEVLEEHEEEMEATPTEEQAIIKNVLNFADRCVHDIMTPRTEIKAVEYTVSLPELKQHITQHIHTRIPVYNDTLDNIKGFLHVKDLLPHLANEEPFNIALILRELLFVPPSMPLIKLLVKMRDAGVHIAIVVDEYGGTDGLVTLEDVFEEIVGEIQDEHDEEETNSALAWNADNHCDMDAVTRIDTIDDALELNLLPAAQENDYDTIGGLVFFALGRVPVRGEKFPLTDGLGCEILSADARRIHRLRLARPAPAQNA